MTAPFPAPALASAPLSAPDLDDVVTAGARASLLRFITCGSVDDGKSTLIGRLLYDSNSVFEDQLEALDRDSKKFGTQGDALDLALLVDGLSAEREQGITIDVAYRYFATPRRAFIVADTPGHEQYTRNMATGASTAELAIILIDARKGILPQTRRHSFIVSMIGVKHVAVAVNKMDLLDFDRETFERISADYRLMAAELGFESITIFPISARDGDNVATRSNKTPWYEGPALLDYLETVEIGAVETSGAALLPVQWVNRPNLDFRGFSGTIARGTLTRGEIVTALPRGTTSRISRIVTADGDLESAHEGQAVTITLADEIDVSRGDVLVTGANPPRPARAYEVRLLWTGDHPLASGTAYVMKLATSLAEARIVIDEAIDIHSFARRPTTTLEMNGIATARVMLDRALAAVPYRDNQDLGGFILIDRFTNDTVAFGLIDEAVIDAAPKIAAPVEEKAQPLFDFFLGDTAEQGFTRPIVTTLVSALLVLALTGSPWVAAIFAPIDFVARPLVRRAFARLRPSATRAAQASEFNADGADI